MNQLPYMPLYWNDLLSDNKVRVMSNEELGAYVRLLGAAWHEDIPGTLPADDDDLARLAGAELSLWRKLSRRILPCFKLNEQSGRYEQKRMMAEHAKVAAQMEMKQSRAALGAEKRWEGHVKKSPTNAQAMLKQPLSNASQSQSQNQSETHTPQAREDVDLDDSEVLPKPDALALAKERLGIPEDFAAMVYEAWKGNGGCNGNRIPTPWMRLVNKRWQSSEGAQWKVGTHREQKNGHAQPNGTTLHAGRPRAEPDTTPLAVDPALFRAFLAATPDFRTFNRLPANEADMPKSMLPDWKTFKATHRK